MVSLENAVQAENWEYDVFLSNASGVFEKEQLIGSGKIADLKATIPANMPAGSGYKLRVRPRDNYAELTPSDAIAIKPFPTATVAGSTTITQGESLPLSITLTGDAPWKGTLSDGTTFSGSANPMLLSLKPVKSTDYSISSIENVCGKGSSAGQASVTVLIPTAEEDFAGGRLRIYPNPAQDVVHVELTMTQKRVVTVRLSDVQGRSFFQRQVGAVTSLIESISMPHTSGTYLLTIQAGQTTLTRKVVRQ
ncbi:T9SS type A sorting domain-containing protein [Spirosoma sp. KNUC1025]|uniref:T9SS type A sorting domain-containing protein n=1 Tax=Spirosoma sp. KNUC1025 TaxID=2894082 RepID=UPI0038666686|nr:T9SS type A sorting domain-containing protein [Spirosoma sp. KNUC1025]